jgi:type IV pilus assembly protein PilB
MNTTDTATNTLTSNQKLVGFISALNIWPQEQLEAFAALSKQQHIPLDQILFEKVGPHRAKLIQAMAHFYQLSVEDELDPEPEIQARNLIPKSVLQQHRIIPYRVFESRKILEILVSQPPQTHILDEISLTTGFRAVPKYIPPDLFKKLWHNLTESNVSTTAAMANLSNLDVSFHGEDIDDRLEQEIQDNDAPIVKLVNALMIEAVQRNASDVHIEAQEEGLVVRFRVDGILQDIQVIPKQFTQSIISRMKVVSNMDISERRIPQDGRMEIRMNDQKLDVRVNTMPNHYAESIVCRILRPMGGIASMEKLGMEPEDTNRVSRMLKSPNGIILVTGPTGSGKTSSLYTMLMALNERGKKIITLEDPVEFALEGITQTPISSKTGLTFAAALRAVMRQDPDIIMLGEIRDEETLDAAIYAAMTGHLVLSTLHANTAVQTITRLRKLGAEPYMIATVLKGVIAQRLVRRICSQCKTSYEASTEDMMTLGFGESQTALSLYKGAGCVQCHHQGYKGRVGLFEIMGIDREMEELINRDSPTFHLQDVATQKGMITLGMEGERKVASGMTTVEEVTRVLGVNW